MPRKMMLILVCMCTLFLFPMASLAADETIVEVSDAYELEQAIDDATSEKPVIVVLKNDIQLTETICIYRNLDITVRSLEGKTYSIYSAEGERHFDLEGPTLTLQNAVLDGSSKGGGIDINSYSGDITIVTLKEGAVIRNCYRNASSYYGGGAVYLYADSESNAKLVIDGGEIRNNKFDSTTSKYKAGGGGIYAEGVGTIVELKRGYIDGNSSQNGGAIKLDEKSQLIMSGGQISNNSNWLNYGSGVFVTGGSSFIMEDGIIEGNKQKDGGGNYYGGGVCIYDDGSSFLMKDGEIKNNGGFIEGAVNTAGCKGGGVCVYATATFMMEGGTVKNNEAATGGGICMSADYPSDTPTIIMKNDSSVEYNYAQYSGGGIGSINPHGALIEMYDDACVKHNEVNKNKDVTNSVAVYNGGGIHLSSNDEDAYIKMNDDSSVYSNIVNGADNGGLGGGIYSTVPVELNNNSTIHDNLITTSGTVQGDGGGMMLMADGNATITDNASIYNNSVSGCGGGIYASNRADVILEKSGSIYGNTAALAGGGVYIDDDAGTEDNPTTFTMNGGKITDNTALGNETISLGEGGGGVYIKTAGTNRSWVVFETSGETYITDNQAPNGHGGGIYCAGVSTDEPWKIVLELDEKTVFMGNAASKAYIPPENVFEKYPNIRFASISIKDLRPYHPLNNYDINFVGDEEYVEPSPEDPIVPEEPVDPENPELDDTTDSGDDFNLTIMLSVMLIAAAAMTATVVVRRRG